MSRSPSTTILTCFLPISKGYCATWHCYRRKRTVSKEDQESANATYLWVSTTTVKVILSLWLPALSLAIRRDLGLLGTLRQGRSLFAVVVVNRVVYRGR